MSAELKTPIISDKGLMAIFRSFALLLVIVGCGQLFTFVVPGFLHLYAVSAWPEGTGTCHTN
jgi:hypothetical protein